MNQSLTVYRASAGSGKTFTLASEYIKLLITNPLNYRSILAVTFTNKATEEMKMRILSQLYGIWKQLPDSNSYIDKVIKELEISEKFASERAGIALGYLLHNYNYFRVETIDAFFQSVLNNLARELQLNANLRVVLNDVQVEQQAVDEIIEELEPNSKVLTWIMGYIKDNIEDDKGWNVINLIKKFGENIFKDFYKNNSEKLNECLKQDGFFDAYVSKLRAIKDDSSKKITQFAETFFDEIDKNGLTVDDFAHKKSGVWGYFNKLSEGEFGGDRFVNSYVEAAMEDSVNWVSKAKKEQNNYILSVVNSSLFQLLNDCEEVRKIQARLYNSADITLHHINQLRLLNNIETKVREINDDNNQFLLSDTQTLLHKLMEDSDSPFIFEKIGTQLEHIMIDEFQDTSTVQWRNFKVLLQECMSHQSSKNMLVGDVKQSIYRWRSGDWSILNNIKDEFSVRTDEIDIKTLAINYRSNGNIIRFNNAFFKAAIDVEYANQYEKNPERAKHLRQAYSDVEQGISSGNEQEGLVHIELLPKEDYVEQTMVLLTKTVDRLIDQGISPSNIAIIVRVNNSITAIADYFIHERPNIKLVSDEAFKLCASQAVNIIIDALRYLISPDDKITLANLAKMYQNLILNNLAEDNELFTKESNINRLLPPKYINNKDKLISMPLFDLVEQICYIFEINKLADQSAYVCAFYDQLNTFLQSNIANIDTFLKEWDQSIYNKSIQSDEVDGIRLLTIHKSKGLEFDNVIMPFCDWQLEHKGIIWCEPAETPFSELPIVPVEYNSKLEGTIYENDYLNEHFQNAVDNLNMLYVAFTRASKNMFVFGKREKTNIRSYLIEQCIDNVAKTIGNCLLEGLELDKTEKVVFEYGNLSLSGNKSTMKSTKNVFNQIASPYNIKVKTYENNIEFRQSNNSKDFVNGDTIDDKQRSYIEIGNILHNIFSNIHTTKDIENAMKSLENEGLLYNDIIKKEALLTMIRTRLEDPKINGWFSDKWTLFNECSILSVDKNTNRTIERRPDRVMMDKNEIIVVDFKFGKHRDEYNNQVLEYMKILDEMGYNNIKGYLWFVYTNEIIEVK